MKTKPLSQSAFLLLVLACSLSAAFLPVLWPQIDIRTAAFFLKSHPELQTNPTLWVNLINEYTPDLFRSVALALLIGWSVLVLSRRLKHQALVLAFVGFSLLLGPGLATWAVKEHQLRARPFDVVEFGGQRQCTMNCAFVSGHVACGFFFASLMLLDPRRRRWWIATGVAAGLIIGYARMSVGAHWLSDVLWAFPITLASSWLVWRALAFFYPKELPPELA
jgi:lipid A 4'-phosphatase